MKKTTDLEDTLRRAAILETSIREGKLKYDDERPLRNVPDPALPGWMSAEHIVRMPNENDDPWFAMVLEMMWEDRKAQLREDLDRFACLAGGALDEKMSCRERLLNEVKEALHMVERNFPVSKLPYAMSRLGRHDMKVLVMMLEKGSLEALDRLLVIADTLARGYTSEGLPLLIFLNLTLNMAADSGPRSLRERVRGVIEEWRRERITSVVEEALRPQGEG